MEPAQICHIRRNLYELVKYTDCNTTLRVLLCMEYVLSQEEMHILESIDNALMRSTKLYNMVMTKFNGYKALIKALKETRQSGAVYVLEQLYHESGSPTSSDDEGSSISTGQEEPVSTQDAEVDILTLKCPPEICALFDENIGPNYRLSVNVIPPTADDKVQLQKSKYQLRKAYGFILNIIQFEGPCLACRTVLRDTREGAHVDSANMTTLLEKLDFQIFPNVEFRNKKYKTKEDIESQLEMFRDKCIADKVDCFLIFIGSHGYNDVVLTSDRETLDIYNDLIYKFQFKESELKKRVAKIFINNSCQVDPPSGVSNSTSTRRSEGDLEPDVKHTFYVKAQMSKYPSSRDCVFGSYFVFVLTCVVMRNACNTSLLEMMTEVQKYLKYISMKIDSVTRQLCPITQMDFEFPFYFFSGKNMKQTQIKPSRNKTL